MDNYVVFDQKNNSFSSSFMSFTAALYESDYLNHCIEGSLHARRFTPKKVEHIEITEPPKAYKNGTNSTATNRTY